MRPWLVTLFAVLSGLAGLFFYTGIYDAPPLTRTFYDRHGQFIGTLNPHSGGYQIWTPLQHIPQALVDQTLKAEDRFFYFHKGLNPISIVKAASDNIFTSSKIRGASTITQQLAKNLIQEKEGKRLPRTFSNKLRETILALGLELKYSKNWILERYLNSIYYGRQCYGITAAADVYFSKTPSTLTTEEISILVALPKAPTRLVEKWKDRFQFSSVSSASRLGRHFMNYLNPKVEGNNVTTTLHLALQNKNETLVKKLLQERVKKDPLLSTAIVVIDVPTGDVLSMVGSRDYFNEEIQGQVNVATALRSPGSTMKPFTYFAAFAKGFGAGTIVRDEPVNLQADAESEPYIPQNFDRRYHHDVSVKEALANSYNVPAVLTLNEIGLSYYHDLLKKFGFTSLTKPPSHYGLAVTLGSGEVTLLELTNAYAALARGGAYLPTRLFVSDSIPKPQAVTDKASLLAAEIEHILSDPDARLKTFGFNEDMIVEGHTVAVKTGTSYEHRDNWTMGYTDRFAVGVWVGHADGSSVGATTGATGAAPLWHGVMEELLRKRAPEPKMAQSLLKPTVQKMDSSLVETKASWAIVSPIRHGRYRIRAAIPEDFQKIRAQVRLRESETPTLDWYLDGEWIARTEKEEADVWLEPVPGKHLLTVEGPDGKKQQVSFQVEKEIL